jgi:predicted metal-dependent hydrolase
MLESLKTILSNSRSDPQVEIEGHSFPVRIKRTPQARRISLRADAIKREIRVTMPPYAPTSEALRFINQKRQWIAARMESVPENTPLCDGNEMAVEGTAHRIVWREDLPRSVAQKDGELRLGGPKDMVPQRILRWLQREARRTYTSEISHYCALAGEAVPRLQLGDPRSRWGSCSSRGTIALSWRLIMAPANVRRSVIAHEVAHMRHMDHSPEFYAWMDELFEGDRKVADKWLKMHGAGLHRVGR